MPAPGAPASAAETHRPAAPRQHTSALLFLAGSQVQQLVKYEVVDGLAVMEGDIILGPASTLPLRLGLPWAPATNVKSAVALSNRSHLWPRSEIPYVIDRSVSASTIDGINWAIAQLNTTPLRIRPRTAADNDYVVFVDSGSGSGCSSYVGRIGGPQEIQTADCGKGSLIHEILHAAGFYHEQSRGDRDAYVTIVWDEIAPGFEDNFEKRDGRGQDIGPYDYSSIMHYSSHAFSRSGRPTIIPKVPNAKIGQREGLSAGDRAAIAELYGNGPGPSPTPPAPPPTPPTPPSPPNPSPPAPPTPWNGSFAGNYTSSRGNVTCTQSGTVVNCQYPGGVLFCGANNTQLDCGWTGGGQGRATFQRQPNGVLAGTWGDFFSNNSRGQWDLVPAGGGPQPAPPPSPQPQPQPPPPSGSTSLTGNYASTRGPMTCTDAGATVSCTFREPTGLSGRLDCTKDGTGRELSCTWVTLLPPASGRAVFTRRSPTERNLTGTWGYFNATSGGGVWEATAQ